MWNPFERRKLADKPAEAPKASVPKGEVGYVSSDIYKAADITRWDPDALKRKKGLKIYETMMDDDQVKPVLEFKKHAVLARDWFFDVDEDSETAKEDEEKAEFFYQVIEKMDGSFSDKLLLILSALHNGFSVVEKVFKPIDWDGKAMWGIKDLKLRPADTFDGGFKIDPHGNILGIEQVVAGQRLEIPFDKIIHFTHQGEYDGCYGKSDLRACYRSWWSKDIVIKFQNIFLERHASGFIFAQVKENQSLNTTDKTAMQNFLNNITMRAAAIIPGSIELKQFQPVNTSAFSEAIANYDKAIARSVLCPNLLGLSEQGQYGSYSQSETQLKVFFWIIDAIAKRLEECLNEQVFRQLAEWNFGTDQFPPFKFSAMSDDEKKKIVTIWRELVSSQAVTPGDTDEAYLRNLLGFPEKSDSATKGQIFEYHLKAGVLRKKEIRRSLGLVEPLPGDDEIVSLTDITPDPASSDTGGDDDDEPPDPDGDAEEPENEDWVEKQNEWKRAFIRKELAAKPWLRRVNFARIERTLDDRDRLFTDEMNALLGQARAFLEAQVAKVWGERSGANVKPKEIEGISLPRKVVSEMRKTIRTNLTAILEDGYEQARRELPRRKLAKPIRPGMDKTKTEKFLASKSMKIADVYEQRTLEATQRVLENSIKYDRSLKDTRKALEDDTDLTALLPRINAAGRAVNIPARLENIIRTNTADALNQARQALFTEPEMKGFVEAFEYSAILDDRTSEVCEHLNGKILKDFGIYTPPNHFQCRSLLVPVTQLDGWDGKESTPPRVQPQKGFM